MIYKTVLDILFTQKIPLEFSDVTALIIYDLQHAFRLYTS